MNAILSNGKEKRNLSIAIYVIVVQQQVIKQF